MKCDKCGVDIASDKFPHPSISVCESCLPTFLKEIQGNPPEESNENVKHCTNSNESPDNDHLSNVQVASTTHNQNNNNPKNIDKSYVCKECFTVYPNGLTGGECIKCAAKPGDLLPDELRKARSHKCIDKTGDLYCDICGEKNWVAIVKELFFVALLIVISVWIRDDGADLIANFVLLLAFYVGRNVIKVIFQIIK